MTEVELRPGCHPTNDILIEFEFGSKFVVLWFRMCSSDHNKILHMSWQWYCRGMCKISLWSVDQNLTHSIIKFDWISNLIEISLVGQEPELELTKNIGYFFWVFC